MSFNVKWFVFGRQNAPQNTRNWNSTGKGIGKFWHLKSFTYIQCSTAVGRGSCSVLWNFNLLNTFICTLMVKKMNDNSYSIISCIQYYQHTVVFFTSSVTELHIKKISYFIKNPLTYFVLIFCRIYSDFSDHNTLVLLNPFQHSFKQLTS